MIQTLTLSPALGELEKVLDEDLARCHAREAAAYDSATAMSRAPLVLLGAGGLGKHLAGIIRAQSIEVAAFCDNSQRLWGTRIDGIPVTSPAAAAAKYGADAVFVVAIWSAFSTGTMDDHIHHLRRAGCRCVVPFHFFLWKHPEHLPYFNVDLPSRLLEARREVWDCMQLWHDDYSRGEFLAQVRARLHADFSAISAPYPCREYYPEDLVSFDGSDTFIDAGAFDGDSLASFINACAGRFSKAIAFEPDPQNFEKLSATIAGPLSPWQSQINARQQAVSRQSGSFSLMTGLGMSSRAGENGTTVSVTTIDSLLDEQIFPTYLKLDVEGHELPAIEGSTKTLAGLAPMVAACVYHVQDHLWRVPLAIRDARPDYRFYLRPHGFIWDEVCYAAPASTNARGGR